MAATPSRLPTDTVAAIASGDLPGKFAAAEAGAPPRSHFVLPALRVHRKRGGELIWQVSVSFLGPDGAAASFSPHPADGAVGVITTSVRSADGTPHKGKVPTLVRRGKNLGRKNATTPWTQALRDAYSAYRKQAARGADTGSSIGFHATEPPPMLVKKEGATRAVRLDDAFIAAHQNPRAWVQPKLNGVRLVAYACSDDIYPGCAAASGPACEMPGARETGVALYSRTSKPYAGNIEIRKALRAVFEGAAAHGISPVGLRLDGELYAHGAPLELISGQARRGPRDRAGAGAEDIDSRYHVFDAFRVGPAGVTDVPSERRQAALDALAPLFRPPLERVPNTPVTSVAQVHTILAGLLADKYEGVIVRRPGVPYEPGVNGYHSSTLFKIKPIHDAEFTIVGFTTGTRGKDVGALMWVAEVPIAEAKDPKDRRFNVVPKNMTYERRRFLYECLGQAVGPDGTTRFRRDFLGQPLTVEFPSRSSKTGKPEQAKALAVRTYEGGPDPMKTLLADCGAGPK